jgi:hypothetical protein
MARFQEDKEFDFRVAWGFVIARLGREHPNTNRRFNSDALVETAKANLSDERPGVVLHVSHPAFEGGVSGIVFIDGRERAKELAEFVSARKGKTVEEIASEIHLLVLTFGRCGLG